MKLIYRHRKTGQRVIKRFTRWADLLDETWRVYFRSLHVLGKLDCVCAAGCEALDELVNSHILNSQPRPS